jgi:hypothetical protein
MYSIIFVSRLFFAEKAQYKSREHMLCEIAFTPATSRCHVETRYCLVRAIGDWCVVTLCW